MNFIHKIPEKQQNVKPFGATIPSKHTIKSFSPYFSLLLDKYGITLSSRLDKRNSARFVEEGSIDA
jgi:hypothetical protein